MPVLDLPSFVRIMQRLLVGYDGQEAAFRLVMGSINEQAYVVNNGFTEQWSSKRISRVMNGDSPVPDGTKQASSVPEVIDGVYRYFDQLIESAVNPHSGSDEVTKLLDLLKKDETIPEAKYSSLHEVFENEGIGRFLADVFLYALNRTPPKTASTVEIEDIALLAEANYRCPLCHKPLVETIKGVPVKRYEITSVLPDGLGDEQLRKFAELHPLPDKSDRFANLIALDDDCSLQYRTNPTPEEFSQLATLKNQLAKNHKASMEVGNINLEKEIRTVVSALTEITDEGSLEKLSYDALHIEEKMGRSDFILLTQVQMQVVLYYMYIRKLFSESGADFELICLEVKTASKKLENSGLSQGEVIERLSDWFMARSQLPATSKNACDIVVSFFIQDCEVFSK